MAYRLKLKEPLAKGVRRIAGEQLGNAAARLQSPSDPEIGVHEARKSLKRTRALLRLIRPGLGDANFRKANARLRDIARSLSESRDRDVVRALLAELMNAKPSVAKAARHLLEVLARAPAVANGSGAPSHNVAEALREIDAMRREIGGIALHPANFETIVAGLTKSHRAGRKALAQALQNPNEEETLHELRKAAQAYWRQMILIQQAWPEACLARAAAAKHVADLLGLDHDVALLEGALAGPEGQALTAAERRALTRYCLARHRELRAEALPKAQLLFAEQSKQLGARMRDLWSAAQRAARAASRAPGAKNTGGEADGARRSS
ncbi:MAG: CHAD domain-containing protein [Hyphomicrobiaceae bacterium]